MCGEEEMKEVSCSTYSVTESEVQELIGCRGEGVYKITLNTVDVTKRVKKTGAETRRERRKKIRNGSK